MDGKKRNEHQKYVPYCSGDGKVIYKEPIDAPRQPWHGGRDGPCLSPQEDRYWKAALGWNDENEKKSGKK